VKLINLPIIKIVRTSSIASDTPIETQLTVKPVGAVVWDEFLQLQISPATRRSYAAGLRDFFRREFQAAVSPETILAFLQLPEGSAIGHVIAYRGHLLSAGLSAGTVNARLAALKSFVTHAAKRKLCAFSTPSSVNLVQVLGKNAVYCCTKKKVVSKSFCVV
jgi:integrase/recombinase XerC